MPDAINIEALQQYCEEFQRELITIPTTSMDDIFNHFNVLPGIKDRYVLSTLQLEKLLKPYGKDWSKKANVGAIKPRTLQVQIGEVNLEENPLEYRKSWLAMLMKKGVDASDHPFEKEFFEQILATVGHELNMDVLFNGIYNSAGTDAVDVNNGFFKIITDELAIGAQSAIDNAGDATEGFDLTRGNVIATGAITSADALTKLKDMYRQIDDAFRSRPVKMYMSYNVYDKYCDDYKAETGANPYNTKYEQTYLEGSAGMCEIVPLAGMGTSQRVIISPEWNMCVGIDGESDQEKIEVMKTNPKTLAIFLALAFGVQFATLDAVWINDQA
ncbi:hypothetical protein V6R21_32305 [Limibacter armeniacum]|uniref:hypothetical protein n=1 Tax=Limibacter armeniacum TaxID=466084 RepID=UPI002FE6A7FA